MQRYNNKFKQQKVSRNLAEKIVIPFVFMLSYFIFGVAKI
jgi:hypothetical protein